MATPETKQHRPLVSQLMAHNSVPANWNGVEVPFPRGRSVLDFFRAIVQSQPDAVAIKEGKRSMTYRELDAHSNRVADEMVQRGVKLEESVVILLPASCEFLAGVIGVLKAGGTYFPIDVDVPLKRIEFLLSDSASRFVLSDGAGIERLKEWPGKVLDLNRVIYHSSAEPGKDPGVPADPNRRAYITYTSGSTGLPKGVQIEHHALTNLVCYYHKRLKLTAQDRATMLAYVAFDASVADIWPILTCGGIATIPPKGILLDPNGLIAWLAEAEITMTFVPTGLAEILFARSWPAGMKLRYLITGGDRLRVRPPANLPFEVINGYGPTENTVFSTWSVVTPEDGAGQAPPIGGPLDNTTAYVLDENLQPVGVGVPGELYLGGEQVARGYLGRPELNAERFLVDPFIGKPDARMYRTGDWVRWLPDGELDFLGRKDGQIQIRGRRVELGEIEAAIYAHDAVRQVCCVPWLDEGMPSGVIAHLVPETRNGDLGNELRTYLLARLPDFMVPSEFVLHENLPLTPQGKVDRAALTDLQSAKSATTEVVIKGDGLEKALTGLWHSLLPAAAGAPADATFATLGGDSLLAIKLMLGVEEITGQRLEVSSFLMKPTLPGLCEAVRARAAQTEFEPVLVLRKQGTRPPLFCLYAVNGDVEVYFRLAEALGDDQPVIGIRSPGLRDMSKLPKSLEEAAAEVIVSIRKVQPHGAPMMAGYSWSGLLGFEVARQLEKAEGLHCFTALIGTAAPMRPTNLTSRVTHFARYFPAWFWNLATDRKERKQRLKNWRRMARRTRANLAEPHVPTDNWKITPISQHLLDLMEKYRPQTGSNVTMDIFRERDAYKVHAHPLHAWQTSHLPDGGWSRWMRNEPRIHWLEGDHWTIIKPPIVSDLAQAIRSAMDEHLKSGVS